MSNPFHLILDYAHRLASALQPSLTAYAAVGIVGAVMVLLAALVDHVAHNMPSRQRIEQGNIPARYVTRRRPRNEKHRSAAAALRPAAASNKSSPLPKAPLAA